jgi:hypothetical protein
VVPTRCNAKVWFGRSLISKCMKIKKVYASELLLIFRNFDNRITNRLAFLAVITSN